MDKLTTKNIENRDMFKYYTDNPSKGEEMQLFEWYFSKKREMAYHHPPKRTIQAITNPIPIFYSKKKKLRSY